MMPPRRTRPVPTTITAAQLHKLIPEREFQAQVVQLAKACAWWVYHTRDSRGSEAGMPDLFLIRPPRVVFLELKREKGKLRPEQAHVMELLSRCPGVESATLRPSQWEEVKALLVKSRG